MADIRRETGPRTAHEIRGIRDQAEISASVTLENRRKHSQPSWGFDGPKEQIVFTNLLQEYEVCRLRMMAPSNGLPVILHMNVPDIFTGQQSDSDHGAGFIQQIYRDGEKMEPVRLKSFYVPVGQTMESSFSTQFIDANPKPGMRHTYHVTITVQASQPLDLGPYSAEYITLSAQEV